jgi:hypothetical protein
VETTVNRLIRSCFLVILSLTMSAAFASFHLFRIEQIYSNADGTVQFVVMHEVTGSNGENFWSGQALTSTQGSATKVFTFPANLPSSATAGRRVLVATQGFAALGLVTPDYVVPNGFLATGGGAVSFAGVDQVTYASLPTDGVKAIDRNGAQIQNVATNFAGQSASVTAGSTAFSPVPGIWANPNEDGTGYALDYHNGILVLAIYSYQTGGPAQWYLAAGPVVANVFTATLDRYTGGQCISCPFTGKPTLAGNDGNITVRFTSSTTATVNLPNGRVTQIAPFVF